MSKNNLNLLNNSIDDNVIKKLLILKEIQTLFIMLFKNNNFTKQRRIPVRILSRDADLEK